MNIIRPAVQQNDHGALGRTHLGVSYIQQTGLDVLQRAEHGRWIDFGADRSRRGWGGAGLHVGRTQEAQLQQHRSKDRRPHQAPVLSGCNGRQGVVHVG